MKKYSFVILDDENQQTASGGWKRVFDLFLIPKNYVKKGSTDITLSDSSTFIENAEPLEVQFFKPENDSYSAIYEKISKEDFQAKKDIYFIDMNWNNTESIKSTNVEEKNLEDISFDDITKGKIPSVLAGLNLLNILPKNDKPKIVFSGSDKTENIRKVFKLLSNRVLTDDILIGEMTGGGVDNYIDKVEQKVDAYLQARQIAIINRQTANKIQELNEIIKAWNGSIDKADEPLIPDNGTDTNPENCWSLRTLFPKQVNRIELGTDIEENKKVIYEVLNELNFRKIYKWIVFSHGVINGKSIDELCAENNDLVSNRLTAIHHIESKPNFYVSDKSRGDYKVFSEILDTNLNTFPNECLNEIRRRIASNLNKHSSLEINFTNNTTPVKASFQHLGLIKTLAEFGVYIGDIYFMYCSVQTDNKHHFTNPAEDYCPSLNIEANYSIAHSLLTPNFLKISVSIDTDTDKFNSWDSDNPIVREKEKVENKLKENLYGISLKEQAIEDYVCLFSNRYKAKIEIQFGKKRVTVGSDKSITIEGKTENKTEYVFTIKPI